MFVTRDIRAVTRKEIDLPAFRTQVESVRPIGARAEGVRFVKDNEPIGGDNRRGRDAEFFWHRRIIGQIPIADVGPAVIKPIPPIEFDSIGGGGVLMRSEEHTSELQSRFGISYAVF